jgi:hypothetical protein
MVLHYAHTHAIKPARTRMGIFVIWSQEIVKVKAILDNVSKSDHQRFLKRSSCSAFMVNLSRFIP